MQDSELFERNKKAAAARNISTMRISLVGAAVVFFLTLVFSLLSKNEEYISWVYALGTGACLVLLALHSIKKLSHNMAFPYLVQGVMLVYSMLTSGLVWPDSLCVTMLALIFLFPVLCLDKGWRVNLATALAAVLYITFISFYKYPPRLMDEAVNVVVFGLLGCMIGASARRAQLYNFDMVERLRMSEEQYRLAILQSGSIICRYDVNDRSISMEKEAADAFGAPTKCENVPDSIVQNGAVSQDTAADFVDFYNEIIDGKPSGSATFRIKTADGWRWVKASYSAIFSDAGKPMYAIVSHSDATEQRDMEIAYEKWKQEIDDMPREKTVLLEWNLTSDVSEGETGELAGVLRGLPTDAFNARTGAYVEQSVYGIDRQRCMLFFNRERLLGAYHEGAKSSQMIFREIIKDGDYRWMQATVQLVPYPSSGDIKAYLIIKDIDEEKRREIETQARASEDPLTHLLNRAAFEKEVTALFQNDTSGAKHAFLMIDVDKFKGVNDTLGHAAGDKTLIDASRRLHSMLRKDDLIGRLGGDEFAVCMKRVMDRASVTKRAESICNALRQKLGNGVSVSASIGIAIFPLDGQSFDELYRNADTALYKAKKQGGDKFEFYNKDMASAPYVANYTPIDR